MPAPVYTPDRAIHDVELIWEAHAWVFQNKDSYPKQRAEFEQRMFKGSMEDQIVHDELWLLYMLEELEPEPRMTSAEVMATVMLALNTCSPPQLSALDRPLFRGVCAQMKVLGLWACLPNTPTS